MQFFEARLSDADFSRTEFSDYAATRSVFCRCSFERSTFSHPCFGAGTRPSEYLDCSFDRCRITATTPGVARFVRCSFRNCTIRDFFGHFVEFVDCVFSGRIRKAVFFGRTPDHHEELGIDRATNAFHGNDFRDCELIDVSFRGGIDLRAQTLPQGPGYLYLMDGAHALARARKCVLGWDDLEDRRIAMAMLRGLEMDVAGGQEQLFISRESVARIHRDVAARLIRALADTGEPIDDASGSTGLRDRRDR